MLSFSFVITDLRHSFFPDDSAADLVGDIGGVGGEGAQEQESGVKQLLGE